MDKKLLKILLVVGIVTALINTDVKADKELVATCLNPDGFTIDGTAWSLPRAKFAEAHIAPLSKTITCMYGTSATRITMALDTLIPEGYDTTTCSFVKSDPVGKVTKTCPSKTSTGCSVYCEKL